jgi:hypothetical protein
MGRRSHKFTPQEHFESRMTPEPNCGCWLWLGGIGKRSNGSIEGRFRYKDETRAARSAWLLYRGEIPDGSHVLHTCDVSLCVNPDHLYLGSHLENIRDLVVRRRHERYQRTGKYMDRWSSQRFNADGRPLASTRLTQEQIDEIRSTPKRYGVLVDLAKKFDLTVNYVWRLRDGRVCK